VLGGNVCSDVSAARDDCVEHGLCAGEMTRQLHYLNLEWEAMERDQSKIAANQSAQSEPSPPPAASDDSATRWTKAPQRGGRKPRKLEQVKEAMLSDVKERRRTVADLRNMKEKELADVYGVSRDTARKARDAILSELSRINYRQ
jgi:uncharacterized protein YjiS (DUF1127 family)